MEQTAFLSLIGTLILAALAIPLLFDFPHVGIACGIASMAMASRLIAVLAVPVLRIRMSRRQP